MCKPIFGFLMAMLIWVCGVSTVDAANLDAAAIKARLAGQEERLPALDSALEAARLEGVPVSYPQNDLTVARMFIDFGREDLANERIARADTVAMEVEALLDRAEREMREGLFAPRLLEGPLAIRDRNLYGTVTAVEGAREQPVFLTGYGHFNRVIQDIPLLAKMGINFIQFELGPAAAFTQDMEETGRIESYVVAALDRAHAHGIRVDLLLSPHMDPHWWHEKVPETWLDVYPPVSHIPFIKWSVDAPQVRRIQERFLRTIIPRIKDHPALFSLCLSNEPDYRLAPQDAWRVPKWREYLQEVHGNVETLNDRYGTEYASLTEVGLPPFGQAWYPEHPYLDREVSNEAWLYDGIRFNQREFAGWHIWMRDIIHEMAPELPVHAKVMPVVWGRYNLYWGTDPYEFAQLSQLNGNDCYFEPTPRHEPWESTWQVQNMYYDLQRSMKQVPIINTENHLIPDRYEYEVSTNHIYSVLWQGAIHGQGASATWCWQRTYNRESDFEGLIMHRAACTAEMGRVALDLMRLGPEVSTLQNAPSEVTILWSNAAQVHDRRFFHRLYSLYESLNFCGLPIGFLTDEQLLAEGPKQKRIIVTTGVRTMHGDAAEVLRKFQQGGGALVAYGEPGIDRDHYGQDIEPIKADIILDDSLEQRELRDVLLDALEASGISPGYLLHDENGAVAFGVEWRSAKHGQRTLLNLVNLTRHVMTVALPEGTWRELITGSTVADSLALQPNRPQLLQRE